MAGKTRLGLYGTSASAQSGGSAPVCSNPRKTGRSCNLKYFGDISLARRLKVQCISGEPVDTETCRGTCEGGALGAQVGAAVGAGGAVSIDCTPSTRNMSVKVYAFFPGIPGSPSIVSSSVSNPQTFPGTYDSPATGTYEISGTFEEWEAEIELGADRTMLREDSDGFPTQPILNLAENEIADYGDAQKDGLSEGKKTVYYLVAKIGTTLTATILVGGASATNTVTITSGNQFPILTSFGGGIDYGMRAVADIYWSNAGGTASMQAKFQIDSQTPITLTCPLASTSSDGWCSVTGAAGASATSISHFGEAQCGVALFPPYSYTVKARVMALGSDYPATATVNYVSGRHLDGDGNPCATISQGSCAPEFNTTVTMPRYGAGGYRGGSVDTSHSPSWISLGSQFASVFTDQWWAQRVWLNDNQLSVTRDDSRDWRMMIRGPSWKVGTIKHEGHITLDDGSSDTPWTAGSHTTKSVSSGALSLAISGGTGSASRDFSPVKNGEGYAYLRVRVRSTVGDNKALRLRFTNGTTSEDKKYSGTTAAAGTWKTIDLDLLVPDGVTSTHDDQESRYPLTGAGGKPANSGDYWGLNVIEHLLIDQLEDGETYEFDYLELHRVSGTPRFSVLHSFLPWREAWTAGGSTINHKPNFWLEVEGRAVDRCCMFQTVPGSGPPTYTYKTIGESLDDLATITGLTLTKITSFSDPCLTLANPGLLIWGSGSLYRDGWSHGFDVDIATAQDIYAQKLYDEVMAYPGAGDVWASGAFSSTWEIPVRLCKSLRGQGWGVLLATDHSRKNSASATLLDWPTVGGVTPAGTGITDTQGRYQTGSTWGLGHRRHKVFATSRPTFYKTISDLSNRMRHRGVFVTQDSSGIDSVWCKSGLMARSYILDGLVVSEAADNTRGWVSTDTEITASMLSLMATDRGGLQFWLLYVDGGAVYERFSTDGVSWGMPVTIDADGTQAKGFCASDGRRWRYWRNSSGDILGSEVDAAGNDIDSPGFSTGVTGVDDASFGAYEYRYGQQRRGIVLHVIVSGAVQEFTSTDGRTFS